ncbi:predicted protein [Sclerotinia sclerotiorum 1980 UF-70]|uniref:Uncharacterized protein n=1 Tax=Sclerotinia sclerotiorum (strain ATCC 18683 / 1980 / Ss-1) TaxID=665079 RepID=A7EWM5_SCLS1|nr:predicted protein [Sclerotinia sclerotiorum 1980 UF-70]EDN93867.1 predicted protein [Sclerotinia sclerotiorum 1980 UF-70]
MKMTRMGKIQILIGRRDPVRYKTMYQIPGTHPWQFLSD